MRIGALHITLFSRSAWKRGSCGLTDDRTVLGASRLPWREVLVLSEIRKSLMQSDLQFLLRSRVRSCDWLVCGTIGWRYLIPFGSYSAPKSKILEEKTHAECLTS